jgi:hypothetical protein
MMLFPTASKGAKGGKEIHTNPRVKRAKGALGGGGGGSPQRRQMDIYMM